MLLGLDTARPAHALLRLTQVALELLQYLAHCQHPACLVADAPPFCALQPVPASAQPAGIIPASETLFNRQQHMKMKLSCAIEAVTGLPSSSKNSMFFWDP